MPAIPIGQPIINVICHALKARYSAAVWAVPAFRNSRWGIRGWASRDSELVRKRTAQPSPPRLYSSAIVLSAQAVVSELKSSFDEYAPMADRFKPSSPATIKLTDHPRPTVNLLMSQSTSTTTPPNIRWFVPANQKVAVQFKCGRLLSNYRNLSRNFTRVRSLLPLPAALKASPAACQLSLPPLPMQPRDCYRA